MVRIIRSPWWEDAQLGGVLTWHDINDESLSSKVS
jgi:hypothetical protein